MAGTAQLIINIVANINQTRRQIDRVNRDVNNLNNNIRRTTGGGTSSVNALGDSFFRTGLKVAALVIGVYSIGEALGRIVNAGIEFIKTIDDARTSFKVMMGGNIQLADEMLSKVINLSRTSPLSTEMTVKAAQTLVAFGVETDDVVNRLQQLGDVARGNNERFDRLALAFGQMTAAGRLMGQETLQFINAGFNPLAEMADIMAKKLGGVASNYMPKLKKAMEEGAISTKMVYDVFQIATSEGGRFNNAMKEMSKTFSGQINIFKDNALILIGGALKPITDFMKDYLLPVANAIMEKIIIAFGVMGLKIETSAQSAARMAKENQNVANSLTDISDTAKDAEKSMNGNLQSFDQLHSLQQDSKKGGGGTLAGLGDVGQMLSLEAAKSKLTPLMEEFNKADDILKKLMETFSKIKLPELDFNKISEDIKNLQLPEIDFTTIINSINNLSSALSPLLMLGWGTLAWGYTNVLKPLSEYVVNQYLPTWINTFAESIRLFTTIITDLKPLFQWFWDNVLKTLVSWNATVTIASLNGLNKVLKVFSDWCQKNPEIVAGMTKIVTFFFLAWKLIDLSAFIQMSGGVISAFRKIITAIWACTGAKIADIATNMYLKTLYAIDLVKAIASATRAVIKNTAMWIASKTALVAQKAVTLAAMAAQKIWIGVQWLANAALAAFPAVLVITAIVALIKTFLYLMATNKDFLEVVAMVIAGVGYLIAILQNGLMSALSWVGKAFVEFATSSAQAVLDIFINPVIEGLNKLIYALNTVTGTNFSPFQTWAIDKNKVTQIKNQIDSFFNAGKFANPEDYSMKIYQSVKDFDWEKANRKFGVEGLMDMVGGIGSYVSGQTQIDDYKASANVGAENLTMEELTNSVSNAVVQATQTLNTGNNGNAEMVVQIDGNTIGKIIKPYIDNETKRIGNALIKTA